MTILVNLGTPDQPYEAEVRKYLKEFLSDKYVIRLPRLFWLALLHLVILRTRPKKSAELYRRVWTEWGSPLLYYTYSQTGLLNEKTKQDKNSLSFDAAMRYGNPSIRNKLYECVEAGYKDITILPMFPQYSTTTTLSIFELIKTIIKKDRRSFENIRIHAINDFHNNSMYIQSCTKQIIKYQEKNGLPDKLIFSFHGIPESYICEEEPYQKQCIVTASLIAKSLGLEEKQYEVAFQSRFGKAEWIKPYLSERLSELPKEGINNVQIFCPGFVSDCLETIDEIGRESKEEYMEHGGKKFGFIPCLNNNNDFIDAIYEIQKNTDVSLLD